MNLIGSKVMNQLPDHNSDTELADEFAQFFITKTDTIREKFTNIAPYALQDSDIPRLQKFDTMSEEDVKRIIMSMKSNSCELDPMPTTLLKDLQPVLLPYLTELINKSLSEGMFIERWKTVIETSSKEIGFGTDKEKL